MDSKSVWPFSSQSAFPITLELSSSRSSPIILMAVLLPLVLALMAPFVLVAEHLAADPATRAVIVERPQTAIQLVLGLMFCATLFGWPLARLIRSLTFARSLVIDGATVAVTERHLFATRRWSEPISAYLGLAHRVRASLSGLRDELVLVHPDPARTVLLAVANRISREDVARACGFLGIAEISSPEASRLALTAGMLGPAEPKPRLDAVRA